jgi:hypothetical protein
MSASELKAAVPHLLLYVADVPSTEVRNGVLDVGFTPKNGHYLAGGACPFCATSGHHAQGDRMGT